MIKEKKEAPVNQYAYANLLRFIIKERILGLYVMGSWLVAELEHCRFMVRNKE